MKYYNNVYCNVCGVEYNAADTAHTCAPGDLEIIFLEEIDQPDCCNLNFDALATIRLEIIENGSPKNLVAMWEKSAGRKWQA